jgi:hypothetical protein
LFKYGCRELRQRDAFDPAHYVSFLALSGSTEDFINIYPCDRTFPPITLFYTATHGDHVDIVRFLMSDMDVTPSLDEICNVAAPKCLAFCLARLRPVEESTEWSIERIIHFECRPGVDPGRHADCLAIAKNAHRLGRVSAEFAHGRLFQARHVGHDRCFAGLAEHVKPDIDAVYSIAAAQGQWKLLDAIHKIINVPLPRHLLWVAIRYRDCEGIDYLRKSHGMVPTPADLLAALVHSFVSDGQMVRNDNEYEEMKVSLNGLVI